MLVNNTFKCIICGKNFSKDLILGIKRCVCLSCGGGDHIRAHSLYLSVCSEEIKAFNIDIKEHIRLKYDAPNIIYINELNSGIIFPNGVSQTYAK